MTDREMEMKTNIVIKISNLTKTFEDTTVVKDCNMNVPKGCVYGFLGANGAGKTTIFKIMTGVIYPTSGTTQIMDMNMTKDREKFYVK